jgi:hypothetical protein
MRLSIPLVCLVVLPACFDCCGDTFVGDPAGLAEVEGTALANGRFTAIPDGGLVPTVFGPQGGIMVVANLWARNVDRCGAKVSGALVSPAGDRITAEHTSNLHEEADGWASIDGTDFSNALQLIACPGVENGQQWTMEVSVKDRSGREAKSTRKVYADCCQFGQCKTDGGF